jgi:hypothetical protein
VTTRDAEARPLAEAHLGEPVECGAFFHMKWRAVLTWPGIVGLFQWLLQRRGPKYGYVAITRDQMCVLYFRFGPTRVQAEVGRWARSDIRTKLVVGNSYTIDLLADRLDVSLEASTYDEDAAAVVRTLSAPT